MAELPAHNVPKHVAIIMDGNGRWANGRGLPRTMGHRKGVEAVREAVRVASDVGIEYLTLFAFSSENWRRPEAEVSDLMGLLTGFASSANGSICAVTFCHCFSKQRKPRGTIPVSLW